MTGVILINLLIESLDDMDSSTRSRAKAALTDCGAAAVAPLLVILEKGTFRQVADAICVLGKIGDLRATEHLIKMLRHTNLLFRMNAAQALGGLRSPTVVQGLLDALATNDDSEAVQTWLLNSLGNIGDGNAVQPLITFLSQTPSAQLRYTTIKVLGKLGDPRATEPILPFLKDADRHVREHARQALINLGYTSIAPQDGEW